MVTVQKFVQKKRVYYEIIKAICFMIVGSVLVNILTARNKSSHICDFFDVPPSDHLKVFQVYRNKPERLNVHNTHFLPKGAEFFFVDDRKGMEESMKEASVLLEQCGVVSGAYEAMMTLRALAFRADIWRVAMLWLHGGLYMDHKIALTQPLSSFVDLQNDNILLPLDFDHTSQTRYLDGTTRSVLNGLLWSRPRHPILAEILRLQVQHVRERFYGDSSLDITGPNAYGMALQSYPGYVPNRTIEYHSAGRAAYKLA
jgi:hypothetical protein